MSRSLRLIYLDRYHLGDPLFLRGLAHRLAGPESPRWGSVLIHGSTDETAEALEAEGVVPERRAGVLRVATEAHRLLVERSVRQTNKRIVSTLTEFGVAAVSVQGSDRGVIGTTPNGAVNPGRIGWIVDLAMQRVVPVVSALTLTERGVREVAAADVVAAMAHRIGSADTVEVRLIERADGRFDEPEVRDALNGLDVPVRLTTLGGLVAATEGGSTELPKIDGATRQ